MSEKPNQNPFKLFKSFKRPEKFHELKEGEQLKGTLISCREQKIRDQRTGDDKLIWVYRIRLANGDSVHLAGRAILDQQFLDAADDMCGGDMNALRNIPIVINRGKDTTTRDDNQMGTYELLMGELSE